MSKLILKNNQTDEVLSTVDTTGMTQEQVFAQLEVLQGMAGPDEVIERETDGEVTDDRPSSPAAISLADAPVIVSDAIDAPTVLLNTPTGDPVVIVRPDDPLAASAALDPDARLVEAVAAHVETLAKQPELDEPETDKALREHLAKENQ
jgi:hypothetical protein